MFITLSAMVCASYTYFPCQGGRSKYMGKRQKTPTQLNDRNIEEILLYSKVLSFSVTIVVFNDIFFAKRLIAFSKSNYIIRKRRLSF